MDSTFFWLLSVTQPDGPKKVVDKYDWARDLHVKSQKEAEKKRGRVKQAVHGYELEIPVFYQGRQIKDEHSGKRQQNHNNHLRAASLPLPFLAADFLM